MEELENHEKSKSLKYSSSDKKIPINNDFKITINGKEIFDINNNINDDENQKNEHNYSSNNEIPSINNLNFFENDNKPSYFGKDPTDRDIVVNISRLDYDPDACTSKENQSKDKKNDYQNVRMISIVTEADEEDEKNNDNNTIIHKSGNNEIINVKNKTDINSSNNVVYNSKNQVLKEKYGSGKKNNNVNNINDEIFKHYSKSKRKLIKIISNKYFLMIFFTLIVVTILLFLIYIFIRVMG